MNSWLAAFLGLALGAAGMAVWFLLRRGAAQSELANARARAELLDSQLRDRITEIDRLRQELSEASRQREAAERQAAVLATEVEKEREKLAEQKALLQEAESKLTTVFQAAGAAALAANNDRFIALAKATFETLMAEAKGDVDKKQQAIEALLAPIRQLMAQQNQAVASLETKREAAYATIDQKILQIGASHAELRTETAKLVTALRKSDVRGRWGNLQLRNAVEMAGMTKHCDFMEEVTVQVEEDGSMRPDMVVRIPGGVIVVDAKVALEAYLDAIQPDANHAALMAQHARQVESHYKKLAQKRYWDQFERRPKLVVMFMPLESALVAALDVKPDLYAEAMKQHVLIATPTLFVAMLLAIASGWQEQDVAANAREILQVGQQLYKRIQTFVGHLESVGDGLKSANKNYNFAIGSLESMLLPSARKLKELHATTEAAIETPAPIATEVRPVVSSELKTP